MERKEIKNFFKIGDKEIIKEGLNRTNLTDEELNISFKLSKKWSEEMIAQELNYSKRTIQRKKKIIYDKLYSSLREWDKIK